MQDFLQDVRYALRAFRASPGFAIAAVLSLAIGIGANTAIFSVTNALLLRALPYKDAPRLVMLWNRSPGLNITQDWFSTAQYFDIKNGHKGFEDTAIALGNYVNLTGDGDPERVTVFRVSSNLLPMFGATAKFGRLFTAQEDKGNQATTAVLSYGIWARRFGLDPGVVGKAVTLNGQVYQIAGVLPQTFALPHEVLPTLYGGDQPDIFLPFPMDAAAVTFRGREDYNVVGRLKPGVTVAQAQAEMDTITARLRRDHPEVYPANGGLTFGIVPLLDQVVGDVRLPLVILLGAVGFLLLIACANVANLSLARAIGRSKEMAVRAALGASRARVIRQLLTESLVLAITGGGLGVVIAIAGIRGLRVLGFKSVPRLAEVGIDWRVLAFTLAMTGLSAVLFGLVPALRLSRLDLSESLKPAGRGVSGASIWGRGQGLRRLLVVAELALSVVLLIGAGLLIRSFARLTAVAPGFDPRGVLTFELTMTGRKYGDRNVILNSYKELRERLERISGVTAAGAVSAIPLSSAFAWGPITVEGRALQPGENFINADQRMISGHYFETMRIPLVKGRFFNEHDTLDAPRVTIVDQFMAEQLWPNQDPIGKRIRTGGQDSKSPWITVAGVVGRVKQYTLDADSRIAMYLPQTQFATRSMTIVMRGNLPGDANAAIKRELHAVDPDLPVFQVRSMADRVALSLAQRRFLMLLLAAFAAIALTLAVTGAYGVMAYMVSQGEREMGIRIALGATQSRIVALVAGQGATLAGTGVVIGLLGAFLLTRIMRSLLFGVAATDPLTFTGVALMIGAVSLVASYVPARRASRVDPMVTLRGD